MLDRYVIKCCFWICSSETSIDVAIEECSLNLLKKVDKKIVSPLENALYIVTYSQESPNTFLPHKKMMQLEPH
jgi:hypothetical protein